MQLMPVSALKTDAQTKVHWAAPRQENWRDRLPCKQMHRSISPGSEFKGVVMCRWWKESGEKGDTSVHWATHTGCCWLATKLLAGCLGLSLMGLGGVDTLHPLLCLPRLPPFIAYSDKTIRSSLVKQCWIFNCNSMILVVIHMILKASGLLLDCLNWYLTFLSAYRTQIPPWQVTICVIPVY